MEARRRSRRKRGEKEETHGNNGAVSGNYGIDSIRNARLGVRKWLIVASVLHLEASSFAAGLENSTSYIKSRAV